MGSRPAGRKRSSNVAAALLLLSSDGYNIVSALRVTYQDDPHIESALNPKNTCLNDADTALARVSGQTWSPSTNTIDFPPGVWLQEPTGGSNDRERLREALSLGGGRMRGSEQCEAEPSTGARCRQGGTRTSLCCPVALALRNVLKRIVDVSVYNFSCFFAIQYPDKP